MTYDASAPATKDDVRLLMEEMGKLYSANERWKEELHEHMERWKGELHGDMDRWKNEVKTHFDVVAENIRHDAYRGALADKVAQHEDRLCRLETRRSR